MSELLKDEFNFDSFRPSMVALAKDELVFDSFRPCSNALGQSQLNSENCVSMPLIDKNSFNFKKFMIEQEMQQAQKSQLANN